uniref:Large ribosomal subunit protein bL27m n=2 Tax=Anolis carolinensis TaxID=28377 RepID=G1KDU3_ANOCA|nr:PREDICTED: 39S ribosomal protein L27, mitochondrial [Anolis carolinensis]|eukprot:XP_003217324.2 PREDICTED: 39S ribosomal protein L27, mitochondrial [Anolis carolinensis]
MPPAHRQASLPSNPPARSTPTNPADPEARQLRNGQPFGGGEGGMALQLLGRLSFLPSSPAAGGQLLPVSPLNAVAVRFASKKTGGSSKNLGGKSPGKRYGFKKMDGQFVHAGNILATQRVIRWHPGAHVGMGRNKWLYALEDGIVRYTKEVYVPHPRRQESKDIIVQLPRGAVLYKTFINVVPTVEVGSFKLVNML